MTESAGDVKAAGFVICGEFVDSIEDLSLVQKGWLLDALLRDAKGFAPEPSMDPVARILFKAILPSVHRIRGGATGRAEASRENGRLGGRPKKPRNLDENLETYRFSEKPVGLNLEPSSETQEPSPKPRNLTEQNRTELNRTDWNSTEENTLPPYPPQGGGERAEEPPAEIEANREDPVPERKSRKRKEVDLRLLDYERWYSAYPRHKDKFAGQKAWEKAVKAGLAPPIEDALETLEWQKRQRSWSDPQYIPLPASYINRRLWDDSPDKEAPPPPRQPTWPRQASLLSPEERAIEESRTALENVVRRMEQGGEG